MNFKLGRVKKRKKERNLKKILILNKLIKVIGFKEKDIESS